jgi:hypothetical protein
MIRVTLSNMRNVADIFVELGGTVEVSRIIGAKVSAAGEMKRRGSIPVKYWAALIACPKGQEIGLSSEVLMLANAPATASGDAA